ncbi:MAG TPA: IPT/TIG domain-containing protein, partial [Solirubrobacteraceae bacterium]|nr:IPT/TIG domain-containing protein [Solirubrobacteraceae bacterium]
MARRGFGFAAGATATRGVWAALTAMALAVGLLDGATEAGGASGPTVSAISPNNGPGAGGTAVTIAGGGFQAGASVQFGETAARRVAVRSGGVIVATSPPGTGTVDVRVIQAGASSPVTPTDQFAYDPPPRAPWLGLNGNGYTYLGPVDTFVEMGVAYDRSGSIEWQAGERLRERGRLTAGGEALAADMSNGMIPDITIEYPGYQGCGWGQDCLPTGAAARSYVEGFVASAREVLAAYPGAQVLFEAGNEPWGHG